MTSKQILKQAKLSLEQMGYLHNMVYGLRNSQGKVVPAEVHGGTYYSYVVWFDGDQQKWDRIPALTMRALIRKQVITSEQTDAGLRWNITPETRTIVIAWHKAD